MVVKNGDLPWYNPKKKNTVGLNYQKFMESKY